jgi:hypothetical protein
MQLKHLQKAYALAMSAAINDRYEMPTRALFRAIAHQIWLACGQLEEMKSEESLQWSK